MKSDYLKRITRAVAEQNLSGLDKIIEKVIKHERDIGHAHLAAELESLFNKNQHTNTLSLTKVENHRSSYSEASKYGQFILQENLRTNIVLSLEIEEKINRICKEFFAKDRLNHYGFKSKQKILFYGRPGCGKTLAAEVISFQLGLPLLKVHFDTVLSSFFGESASNLSELFQYATKVPSVLLLDECDYIAKSRINSNDVGEAPRIVNTFLQLLEDTNPLGLIIATTNLPKELDQAVFRRFDEIIELKVPNKVEIKKIIKSFCINLTFSKDFNWGKIIEQLDGLSGADIVKITNAAAVETIMNSKKMVSQFDFERAILDFKSSIT
jgi:SpoVK/Ycf46/Vps4 family AAA+-type ATPase